MDHTYFKGKQTAAVYVADALDEAGLEAFELHMLGCAECVDDVETWRAIKANMPKRSRHRELVLPSPRLQTSMSLGHWSMAASIVGVGVVGVAAGWEGETLFTPDMDSKQTVMYNMPTASRGAEECSSLRLASDTRVAYVRVQGAESSVGIAAFSTEGQPLPENHYSYRRQPDGSFLVHLDYALLAARAVHLRATSADGFEEPLGCVVGVSQDGQDLEHP